MKRRNPRLRESTPVVDERWWSRCVDSDGDVYWTKTVDEPEKDCPLCSKGPGACVQMIVRYPNSEAVIHVSKGGLN